MRSGKRTKVLGTATVIYVQVGAEDEIRTHTPLRAPPPQDGVSANFTTSARSLRAHEQMLAGVEGLEPTTCGFGDRCSSQLSYTPLPALSLAMALRGVKWLHKSH